MSLRGYRFACSSGGTEAQTVLTDCLGFLFALRLCRPHFRSLVLSRSAFQCLPGLRSPEKHSYAQRLRTVSSRARPTPHHSARPFPSLAQPFNSVPTLLRLARPSRPRIILKGTGRTLVHAYSSTLRFSLEYTGCPFCGGAACCAHLAPSTLLSPYSSVHPPRDQRRDLSCPVPVHVVGSLN